jgi:Right handed beta helix region
MRRKPFLLTLLFASISLFLSVSRAQGTTYYIDSIGGNDRSNGTSSSTPWQTIAKVDSSSFNPGDSILFKSGDTWREQLNITNSGSAGKPITFGSYGVGALPIISGANLATGWASVSSTNMTIWSVNQTSSANQVFEDGKRLASSVAYGAMSAGSFYYDAGEGKVYVWTFSGDNPNSHMIEVSSRNYAIYEAGGAKYITLQNLQTSSANSTDIYFNGSAFITISYVSAVKSFGEGIRFDVVSSSTIVSSTAAWNGSNGISADDAPSLVINGCIAHDNASFANVNYTAGIKISPDYAPYLSSTNVTIENSESYSNGVGQPDWRGAGIWADTIGNDLLVQYNLVYGNNLSGIYLDADHGGTVKYNVVYRNGQAGAVNGDGIIVNGDGRVTFGNSVYGNTVYANLTAGIRVMGASLTSGCYGNTVENNIAVGTISGPNVSATGGCENSGVDGSGNIYTYNALGVQSLNFVEYGVSNYLSSYAAFDDAYGTSTHSIQGDPLFTNSGANDFTLQSNSPAIGHGLNLGPTYQLALAPSSVWPSGVVTMNETTEGAGWGVGAYVYNAAPTPSAPVNVTVTVH